MTDEEPQPSGRLRPVSAVAIAAWAGCGLVLGWLVHPLSERWLGVAPVVTWLPALLLFFIAATLVGTARATRQARDGVRPRLAAHQMVNRFVLARATVMVGSVVAGGYAGYALSWFGPDAELATQRLTRSALASLAAAAMVLGGVLLERACRVRSDDDEA